MSHFDIMLIIKNYKKKLLILFLLLFLLPITTTNAQEIQCKGMEAGDECTAGNYTIRYNSIDEFGNRKFIIKQVNVGFDDRYIDSPYLIEYLSVMYKYAIIATSILVTIVIMFAGILWLTSAGNVEQIGRAKKMISRAITGLIIAIGSYTILWTINPQLVEFGSLKILRVKDLSIQDALFTLEKEIPTTGTVNNSSGSNKSINDTTYDAIFKKYASCIPADWRILKGIAYKESSLNPTLVHKVTGYAGLFQTKTSNCQWMLKKYGWTSKCDDVFNPDNNTAVGMGFVDAGLKIINSACPNASVKDKLIALYLTNNSGPGAVKNAMDSNAYNGGCTYEAMKRGLINHWNRHKNGQFNGKNYGEKRFAYAESVADLILNLGVTDIVGDKIPKSPECPK